MQKIYKTISTEYETEFHLILSKNFHKKCKINQREIDFYLRKKIANG